MGFFSKLHEGLSKTRSKIVTGILGVLGTGKLTDKTLEDLEEQLLAADISYEIAGEIIAAVRKRCFGQELSPGMLTKHLEEITSSYMLENPGTSIQKDEGHPYVILVLGINGVGKTTSIAKLAHYYKNQGKKVLVAAGDTFRAGAIEQISMWCEKLGIDIVKHQDKSDAAAVVYDAYEAAKSRGHDVLIIDTAGRLHNKSHLMDELKKLVRVLKKHGEHLPQETLLVIDGNTGQNAILQAKAFNEVTHIDGFVVTKLDGTAKGGSLISINYEMKIPIKWIGVGEKMDDLIPFSKTEFINGMFDEKAIEV